MGQETAADKMRKNKNGAYESWCSFQNASSEESAIFQTAVTVVTVKENKCHDVNTRLMVVTQEHCWRAAMMDFTSDLFAVRLLSPDITSASIATSKLYDWTVSIVLYLLFNLTLSSKLTLQNKEKVKRTIRFKYFSEAATVFHLTNCIDRRYMRLTCDTFSILAAVDI